MEVRKNSGRTFIHSFKDLRYEAPNLLNTGKSTRTHNMTDRGQVRGWVLSGK